MRALDVANELFKETTWDVFVDALDITEWTLLFRQVEKVLDPKGRERRLRQASKSVFGLV